MPGDYSGSDLGIRVRRQMVREQRRKYLIKQFEYIRLALKWLDDCFYLYCSVLDTLWIDKNSLPEKKPAQWRAKGVLMEIQITRPNHGK